MADDTGATLVVLIAGRVAGVIDQRRGVLTLTYDDEYRHREDATPLSVSMPLATRVHADPTVRPFLWGLLPDSEQVLDRWARQFQVSARSPFALLGEVGEDCAGAAQFALPERVEALAVAEGGLEPVADGEIASRLRLLREDPTAWHAARATGQFSLSGAQAKTALHRDPESGAWGDPWGATPTTHILKPAVAGFDDHDLNEHICLETARALGLVAARSAVTSFGDERAIVIERYDRVRGASGLVVRVHQEDACQALGVLPTMKYENEGGPGIDDIANVLRREVRPAAQAAAAIWRLVDAVAFNWVIAGTDAHAKNYSLLLSGRQVRLAPLYDIASALPYDDMYLPKLRSAMRIGREYRLDQINRRHWERLAIGLELEPEEVAVRVADLARRTPDAIETVVSDDSIRDLESPMPQRFRDRAAKRAASCATALA